MLSRSLDQFFTRPAVAKHCLQYVNAHCTGDNWLWIEPSAGQGAFLDLMDFPKIGIDICSGRNDVLRADFLEWQPCGLDQSGRKIAVIGNPPFGKNASLGRKFFDHAANFADVIAFILPRTFEKPGFINRLNRHMHLVFSQVLEKWAFEFDGEPYDVPTVFQIWEKREALRPILKPSLTHGDFDFVPPGIADFAFQRVGARAGLVSYEGLRKSPQSHYFLRANGQPRVLFNRLRSINWEPIKWRTAGNPSIGKAELVTAYMEAMG